MEITYKTTQTLAEFIHAIKIRVDVFIKEQGFDPGWEPDEDDKTAIHYIAVVDNTVVATARVRETKKSEFKLERMATQKGYRGKGIGTGLLRYIIKQLAKRKPKRIWMQAQCQAQSFYEKFGFVPIAQPINRWGVNHINMEYAIKNPY